MRVLITGGAGRLGSALTELLIRKHKVKIFDLVTADFSRVKGIPGVEYVFGDITDYSRVEEAVAGMDSVVHLAALLPPEARRAAKRRWLSMLEEPRIS